MDLSEGPNIYHSLQAKTAQTKYKLITCVSTDYIDCNEIKVYHHLTHSDFSIYFLKKQPYRHILYSQCHPHTIFYIGKETY